MNLRLDSESQLSPLSLPMSLLHVMMPFDAASAVVVVFVVECRG